MLVVLHFLTNCTTDSIVRQAMLSSNCYFCLTIKSRLIALPEVELPLSGDTEY